MVVSGCPSSTQFSIEIEININLFISVYSYLQLFLFCDFDFAMRFAIELHGSTVRRVSRHMKTNRQMMTKVGSTTRTYFLTSRSKEALKSLRKRVVTILGFSQTNAKNEVSASSSWIFN